MAGRTREEAEEKYQEYHRHASIEGALTHFSSSSGIDCRDTKRMNRSVSRKTTSNKVEAITTLSREPWTLRRIIGQMGLGSRNAPIVGSADEVANELTWWVDDAGVGGST